ncbi:GTPase-associated protein 1-related protein [Streptomyces sp. NPDC001348]
MRLYRLGDALHPNEPAAVPRPDSAVGRAGLPAELPRSAEPLLADAARPRPGVPGPVLSHTRTRGGDTLLCRTVAADGAARARQVTACHLPAGPDGLPDRTPVETWRSPLWDTSWTLDVAADGIPEWCDDEHLARFAAEHAERVEPFLADVRRLFSAPAGRQIVIAERDPDTVAHWIALACASLPAVHARALTFDLCAVDPGSAPQQILGIGPESGFERHDETTLNHLYRVHDGLGGPGSPPMAGPDTWAQVAAQVWHEGRAPRAAYARGTGATPFDLGPLQDLLQDLLHPNRWKMPGLVRRASRPGNAEALGEAGRRPATQAAEPEDDANLPGGAMHAQRGDIPTDPVGTHPGAARPAGASSPPLSRAEVTAVLGDLDARVPEGAEDRLGTILAGLGPGADRAEVVTRLVVAVDARLNGPPAQWAYLLEILHAVSAAREGPGGSATDGGRSAPEALEEKVAARLARYLVGPNASPDPATGELLDRLPLRLQRLLLDRLAESDPGEAPQKLVELAASPLGAWLTGRYDQAPLRLRLVLQAHRLRTNQVGGLQLFRTLLESSPAAPEREPWMLQLMWWLTWPRGGPGPAEAVALLVLCPHGLVVDAGLDRLLARLLTAPNAPVDELGALARELVAMGARLTPQQDHLATVLTLGRQLEAHDIAPHEAIERMETLLGTHRVPESMRAHFTRKLAVRLAEAEPAELYDPYIVRRLSRPLDEDLLAHYVTAQLTPPRKQRLVEALASSHHDAARLFIAWREDNLAASTAWKGAVARLVDEVFGDLVARLRRSTGVDHIEKVARSLDSHEPAEWVRVWHDFVNGRAGPGPTPPEPAPD